MKKICFILILALVLVASMSVTAFANGEAGAINSAQYGNTYVVKNDGSLWSWGGKYTGNGSKEAQATPTKILDNVRSVSGGLFGAVAVKKDDTLWGWGYYLGSHPTVDKDSGAQLSPTKLGIDDVKMAAAGNSYLLALKNDNSLWVCGKMFIGDGSDTMADGTDGFKKVCDDVISMHASDDTVYLIKEDNTLWGYGDNSKAQLGNMTTSGDTNTNKELSLTKIMDDVKYVTACPDGDVVFAIRLNNSLYAWADAGFYAEGFGWVEDAGSPYKVIDNVKNAAVDGKNAFIVKTDNTLWGWGNSYEGKVVNSNQMPYKIANNVLSVTLGERHASVIKTDNTLWTMGGNYRGGLGYASDETWYTPLTKILSGVKDSPAGWAIEEVEKAIGEELIPENLQGDYGKSITREEFCILAIRMIEVRSEMDIDQYLDEVGVKIAPIGIFSDCDTKEVRAAKVLGITDGVGDGKFAPDKLLNREQAAKVLATTALACGRDVNLSTPAYADKDKIADWAKPYTGYVADINVMKGVGANRFDPQGSYQRQQAFMTMYRIWKAIDKVDPGNVKIQGTEVSDNDTETSENNTDSTLAGIKKEISNKPYPNGFIAYIEGTSRDEDGSVNIKYDVYYENADINIATYYGDRIVSNSIYNDLSSRTYTATTMGTDYAEVLEGNWLPIRFLNIETFEMIENNPEVQSFVWEYKKLDGERVIYTKTVMKDGVTTEFWYSLKYSIPLKFHQEWMDEDGFTRIDWTVKSVDETVNLDDSKFDIPDDL